VEPWNSYLTLTTYDIRWPRAEIHTDAVNFEVASPVGNFELRERTHSRTSKFSMTNARHWFSVDRDC
jgi:hypothetical protein